MKKVLSFLCLSFITATVLAVPAKRKPFTVTQSDGTKLTLVLTGDENMHYYLNTATGEKMQLAENGDYVNVNASKLATMQTVAKARRQKRETLRKARLAQRRVGDTNSGMTGKKKGLVILVNYSDKKMNSSHTQSTFNDMFNKVGYSENNHIGSVSDYFKSQSYGNFELSFDVIGPVTVSNTLSYYGSNDSEGNDKHPASMVIEACKLADANGVNFKDYDWDGDGNVDQVFVIYAGYGENSGASDNTIWPHEWTLTEAKAFGDGTGALTLDEVNIDTYACACELEGVSGTTLCGIGTSCHEFSHCLGYPDFYDTDYSGGVAMDSFDLMSGGSYNGPGYNGEVPVGFTAYERWCAGWLTPTVLNEGNTITDMKDLGSTAEAYIIYNDGNENEYYLLENRQAKDWFKYFNKATAGHGLFVTHVDYDKEAWEANEPNDVPSHQRMTWIAADGNYGTSSLTEINVTPEGAKGDFFPGTSNVTSLTNTSHTGVGGKLFNKNTDGTYFMNKPLTDITENTTDGTISFKFNGGADDGSRYTVTYDACGGTCSTASWTQTIYNETAKLPEATISTEGWTFAGWSETSVDSTTTKPTLYAAGSAYTVTKDVTLYAVYQYAQEGTEASGCYTLDYSEETALQSSKNWSYGKSITYTAADGSEWVIKAYKNSGMQVNKGKDASVKVPECPGKISTIEMTTDRAKVLRFNTTDFYGDDLPEGVAHSESTTSPVLDLNGLDLYTGYIYTIDGATSIKKIVVNYGEYAIYTYDSNPDETTTTPDDPDEPAEYPEGDLNHDGKVNVADVTRLVDIILGRE